MKKAGLIILTIMLAAGLGCGQSGNKSSNQPAVQETNQGPLRDAQRGPGPGQPGGRRQFSPEDQAKRQTENIGEYVKFTEGQETKVYELNLKYAKLRQEMWRSGRPGEMTEAAREDMRVKMETQQQEMNKELKSILTGDQFKKYEQYLEERMQRMRERGGQRGPQ